MSFDSSLAPILKAVFSGPARARRLGLVAVLLAFAVSRAIYAFGFGFRFEDQTLGYYMQYIDPTLLRSRLVESLYYLRDQPPLFNLFLGVVLKAFPAHSQQAFHVVYLGFGLTLVVSLYLLMVRLDVRPALAAAVAVVYAVSPTNVLYEHWLFYTYPITALLALSAVFLHRFVVDRRLRDAVVFFFLLATIALGRGIFHFAWIAAPAIGLVVFCWPDRRRVALAAIVPLLLVAAFYVKTYVVFGGFASGELFQQLNLAAMTVKRLPPDVRKALIQQGRLTPVSTTAIGAKTPLKAFDPYVPGRAPTGIPVLDQEEKPGGNTNWQSRAAADVAAVYGKDGLYVLKEYPGIYLQSVADNVARYVLPSSDTSPIVSKRGFGIKRAVNGRKVSGLVRVYNTVLGGQIRSRDTAWFLVVAFPACLLFALLLVGRWLWRRRPEADAARVLTVLFGLFNIIYVSAVTLLFSAGDHNRYRFKVGPFYCLLFTMLLQALWSRRGLLPRLFGRRTPAPPIELGSPGRTDSV